MTNVETTSEIRTMEMLNALERETRVAGWGRQTRAISPVWECVRELRRI